jgi:Polyketide cyclase / dehydrase and lipid transport
MRIIKAAGIIILVFVLLLTGISLLLPSHTRVSRTINIQRPKDSVYAFVNNPQNWRYWYPAFTNNAEITAKITYSADGKALITPDGGITITGNTADEVQVSFRQRDNVLNGAFTILKIPNGDSSIVQWYFDEHAKWYPWEKFRSLLADKTIGPSMEEGLTNMKRFLER